MGISNKITKYVENSKVNGKFIYWNKSVINVYIAEIVSNITSKEYYYSEVKRAVNSWNKYLKDLSINRQFLMTIAPSNADIIINWTKVGRKTEGMCKYLSVINSEIRKVSIDVGLYNEYSGKNTSDESIYFVMMHELGHSLGLGHGVEVDDVMFVPHQKNVSIPSENDLYVLKQIYYS